jgi:hypothetical protein
MTTLTDLAFKATRVAESCRTPEQAATAMRYVMRVQTLVDRTVKLVGDIPEVLMQEDYDDIAQAEAILVSARFHLVDMGAPEVRRATAHTYFQTLRHKRF